MDVVLLIARLLLALVFGVAAVAKMIDLSGSRRAFVGFGVPAGLASVLGYSLPFVEILVAVALIPLSTAWWGAVGALALLTVFIAGISVSIARGQSPDCHCFGQLHSAPVGRTTLTRNIVLAAVASLVVVTGKNNPGLSATAWLSDLRTADVLNLSVGLIAVALLAAAVVYLRRILNRQAAVLERMEAMQKVIDEDYAEPLIEREDVALPIEGLPVGAPAPGFSLAAIDGQLVTLDDLLAYGKPVLLLFVSPNCSPCKTLLPLIRVWERDYGDHLTFALLSKGTLKENQDRVAKYGATHLLLEDESAIADDYQAKWTPAAVLIGRQGKIASEVTYGDEAIRALVTHSVATTNAEPAASNGGRRPQITIGTSLFKLGEPSPRFSLPDPQGKMIDAEDLLGKDTLLLFWNPACSFCQAMSEDIKRWEENPPSGAPRLVFISLGDGKSIQENSKNFKSLFLHDQEFDLGNIFGTNSTPSALLIGADGRIASSLAVGEQKILALIGFRKVTLPIATGFAGAHEKEPSRIQ